MFNENLMSPSLVSLDEIPHLWQHSDVLIFLVDLNDYDTLNTGYLSSIELESLARLKTSHFKRRYIISRTVLKRILCNVTGESSASGISTYKDGDGRVCILNNSELYICISYTESVVALAISKVEVGIDIELEKRLALKSNLKNLSMKLLSTDETISDTDLLKIWTLKEAYSKFSNNKMHLIFNKKLDLSSVNYRTFILNEKYILSVITNSKSHIIDINCLHRIDFN